MSGSGSADALLALAIFFAGTAFYGLLHTQQYLAVDGAVRCVNVYWNSYRIAGDNNHLLYYANVTLWRDFLSQFGIEATDPFNFVHLTEWMNALAAAGSVSIFWLLCKRATGRIAIASAAAAAYAFSNAFLLHATSTAEPMVGLLWSFVSVGLAAWGLSARSYLLLFAGGAFLLLAMATYESMVLIGPAELALIWGWKDGNEAGKRLVWFLAGCIVGGLLAYVPIYYLSGTTNPLYMWRRFAAMGGGDRVYGRVTIAKIVNLPFGFASGIFGALPLDYGGIRSLRTESVDTILIAVGAVLISILWFSWTVIRSVYARALLSPNQRLFLSCCLVALIFDALALIYWDPLYDKLWLQPLAAVILGWSVIFTGWRTLHRQWKVLIPEAFAALVIVTAGFARAVDAHSEPTPCLDAAHQLSTIVDSSDLLVTSWDPISLLYSSFLRNRATTFDLPAVAVAAGPLTTKLLVNFFAPVRQGGHSVFFLGILDVPETTWKTFLEDKCGLPYHSIDDLRKCAKPVATLTCENRSKVLWELPAVCSGGK